MRPTLGPFILAPTLLFAHPAAAQPTCRPPSGSNEARLIAFATMPMVYAPLGAPAPMARGGVIVGGDLSFVPDPPRAIRRPEFCYTPKDENARLAPVLPRPRLLVGLGGGFSLDLTYLPPVTVADATPNFGSAAVGYARRVRSVDLTARAHATFGSVRGPVTCPRSALTANPAGPCFGNEPSDDRFTPGVLGLDAGLAAPLAGGWRWFAALGVQRLDAEFQVDFTNAAGGRDNTLVAVDLARMSLLGGVERQIGSALTLTGQVYAVPQDGATARAGLRWRVR